MGTVFGALGAYLLAEFTMTGQPHPAHWIMAALGAGAGFLGGELFNRRRDPF
jgi:UDP-N-acetylmuramyl pentapeptide phosphotransferase/UDP-N-acetylglucosamine-1-phosphate transferase